MSWRRARSAPDEAPAGKGCLCRGEPAPALPLRLPALPRDDRRDPLRGGLGDRGARRFYGGRYVCAPAARLDAAELHVCLFERGGRLAVPLFGAALVLGLLPRLPGYRVVRGRRVTIEGPPGDPVQGDGDVIARLPVTVALDERPLALVVPDGGPGGRGALTQPAPAGGPAAGSRSCHDNFIAASSQRALGHG
ncbi:MAG: hypothetical protein U1E53_29085 [Dongiaceae bacterium]